MAIPSVDPTTGLLPAAAGAYSASFQEIEQQFVVQAPNSVERADIFAALCVWATRVRATFGSGRIWIDGGFVTHKAPPPHDVDVVFIPDDPDRVNDELLLAQGYELLTLQQLFFLHPGTGGTLERLQPVGGLVDAFIADPRRADALQYWHALWSAVKLIDGSISQDQTKGYLEVIL